MRPVEDVVDEASVRWVEDVPWLDALSLAAGAGMAVWVDPETAECIGVTELEGIIDA